MLRSILGGIAGYIVMFVFIFTTFTALFLALGVDATFAPGTYDVSMTWIAISTVLGTVAAIVGGYLAAVIGKGFTAVKILAGIILVMGVLTIAMMLMTPPPAGARIAGEVANLEAMTKAQTPIWTAILNPIIGIIGAVIGGRLRK